MGRIILITGGCRSGKSAYGLARGVELAGPRLFVATCPPLDDEMRERITRHRMARDESMWDTCEAVPHAVPLANTVSLPDLAKVLEGAGKYNVVLVDCLTLWIGNMMHDREVRGAELLTEQDVAKKCRGLLEAARGNSGTFIFVTNETGMGIIPDNPSARLFRDLSGRCNQVMAVGADEVVLMTCGLPLKIKGWL